MLKDNKTIDEISLLEMLQAFWKDKVIIFCITLFFAISSVFYALSLDNLYKSEVILEVSSTGSGLGTMASRFGGIASLAGVGNFPSVPRDKSSLAYEMIKSKDIVKSIYKYDGVSEGIVAIDYFDPVTQEINYDKDIYDNNTDTWVREVEYPYKKEPSYLEIYKILNEGIMSVYKDSKTGFIKLSISHESPIFAKELIEKIIYEVNESSRKDDLTNSSSSLDYLNDQLLRNPVNDMKMSINDLIKSNMEIKMLANIKEHYLIKPIDGPHIPELKYAPTRSTICIVITIFGFVISLAFSFLKTFFYPWKKR
mgnify:CR=1 FL=1